MKISIIIFIMLILTFFRANCSENDNQTIVDTSLRYSNIIDYIKRDSVIKEIILKYYPPINCFAFPDTTVFLQYDYRDYLLIIGDTSTKYYSVFELKYKDFIDSINLYRSEKYICEKTNYFNKNKCTSDYQFVISLITNDVWSIIIVPKDILPGLFRSIGYLFLFDKENRIIKTNTTFAQE